MLDLFILLFFYILIILSVLGYGLLFQNFLYQKIERYDLGYVGLYGIFFLILYSYISNLLISHSSYHNFFIHLIGLLLLIYYINKERIKFVQFNYFFTVVLIIFLAILISKNHDDFIYYHFPYTYWLTQNDIVLGLGNFGHGFRTQSSIFYLNSLFYLPKIEFHLFNLGAVLFVIFTNLILLKKIFYKSKKPRQNKAVIDFIKILSLFGLILINIFFYRIAEHGTDRSAQILIFILFIEIIYFTNIKKYSKINLYKIYMLLGLIISLKAFYFLYLISLMVPFVYIYKKKKFFESLIFFIKNKSMIFFFLIIFFTILTNFFNSGCLVYPISITCNEHLIWSIPVNEVVQMNNWYEIWSKAGAGPNFRVDNPDNYIRNFNWVMNWFDIYFFNKVSDFLVGVVFIIILIICFFYNNKKKIIRNNFRLSYIYILLILLFFEWFFYHPALRYGGYILLYLLLVIPTSFYLTKKNISNIDFFKKSKIIITVTIIIFISRNIDRIIDEHYKYSYNPLASPYYNVNENYFRISKKFEEIKSKNVFCDLMTSSKVCTSRTLKKLIIINQH